MHALVNEKIVQMQSERATTVLQPLFCKPPISAYHSAPLGSRTVSQHKPRGTSLDSILFPHSMSLALRASFALPLGQT